MPEGDPSAPAMEAFLLVRVSDREWNSESLFETLVDPLLHFQIERPAFVF